MPAQGANDLAAEGVPQTDHPIATARQHGAIGAKRQRSNTSSMLMQAEQELATSEVPHTDGAVAAAAGQVAAIGAERQSIQSVRMALERVQAIATGGRPDAQRMIEPTVGHKLAVWAEDDGMSTSARAAKEVVQAAIGSAPEAQLVAHQACDQELPGGGETQRYQAKHAGKGRMRQISVAEVNCGGGAPRADRPARRSAGRNRSLVDRPPGAATD